MHGPAKVIDGNLRVALATWIYLLHDHDFTADDAAIATACAAVHAAADAEAGDAAGNTLIDRVSALVDEAGDAPNPVIEAWTSRGFAALVDRWPRPSSSSRPGISPSSTTSARSKSRATSECPSVESRSTQMLRLLVW